MLDTEVTVVMRFRWGCEPNEEEVRELVEDQWLGTLVSFDQEDV